MMNDLISRQAAIDAVEFGITYAKAINKSTGEVKELFKEGNKALNDAVERIKDLPSAQSEPSQAARDIATILENEKDMRVIKKNAESESCADTISRKAAIDALMKRDKELRNINWYDKPFAEGECKGIDDALEIINTLPSAQSTMGQVFDGDMISRQAAVDAFKEEEYPCESDYDEGYMAALDKAVWIIEKWLPSAQPTGTPLHDNGSDYAHGFADGYKQGLKDAESERVRCKDCKHWKDSDGVYRRGIGAESKCPVNIRAVYEGNFYCADAERRTDE